MHYFADDTSTDSDSSCSESTHTTSSHSVRSHSSDGSATSYAECLSEYNDISYLEIEHFQLENNNLQSQLQEILDYHTMAESKWHKEVELLHQHGDKLAQELQSQRKLTSILKASISTLQHQLFVTKRPSYFKLDAFPTHMEILQEYMNVTQSITRYIRDFPNKQQCASYLPHLVEQMVELCDQIIQNKFVSICNALQMTKGRFHNSRCYDECLQVLKENHAANVSHASSSWRKVVEEIVDEKLRGVTFELAKRMFLLMWQIHLAGMRFVASDDKKLFVVIKSQSSINVVKVFQPLWQGNNMVKPGYCYHI